MWKQVMLITHLEYQGKVFVVEAKKSGVSFQIPITFNLKRRYTIGLAITKDAVIKAALIQAQRYCFQQGVRFGIITNGQQYIIFEALRPGESWQNAQCEIFYNLDDIMKNFTTFWNLLSKDAVENNSLVERLSMNVEELKFIRPMDNIHLRNVREPRNDLFQYLTPIIKYAFEEITAPDKSDMLEKCFVYEKEFAEVDKSLKTYFSTDMSKVYKEFDLKKIITDEKTAGVFQADFDKYSKLLDKGAQEPTIFVLLGGVGAGKTTFIHRFFNIILTNEPQQKRLWFYVNFRDAPIDEKEIRKYILESILKDFFKKYEKLAEYVKTELKFENIQPTTEDITKLFALLRAMGNVLSIAIDNVDQHKSSSPTFHENVFLEANSLTKLLKTLTIVALREESFYRSDISGAFNAYYVQRYMISPPNFVTLLCYRLDYVIELLKMPEADFKKRISTNIEFGRKQVAICDFLQIVRDSIINQDPRKGISAFMSHITGGDMRKALDLFATFLVSGNTKIREMLDIYRYSGTYKVAYHQFIRAIVLGQHKYYSGESSYLINLFDVYAKSHFLSLKILKYAYDHIDDNSDFERGYIPINALLNAATEISINIKSIEDCLLNLAKYSLVVLDTRRRDSLEKASYFKITGSGSYYLNILVCRFSYLDLIWIDTPIADLDLVQKLRGIADETELDMRFERTKLFLDYIAKMEEREIRLNTQYQESSFGKQKFVKRIIDEFQMQEKYIRHKLREKETKYETEY